jgi:glycosyltransferase involved in cell wall biosynthesis
MRVVQLGPWPPPFGGVQTHLVALRRRMDAAGVANQVVNITSAADSGVAGVHYPRSAAALIRTLVSIPSDIIHLHLGGHLSGRLLALAAICASLPRRRTVLTFHSGGYPSSPAGQTASPRTLRGMVLRRFDRIIVVNRELETLFVRFGCEPSRIRVIRPHAHPDRSAAERETLEPRLESFRQAHDPLLVSVNLLEPEYDIPLQIEALASIRTTHSRAGLLVLGSGSLDVSIRQAAASSPVAEHILVAGDVAHEQTLALLRRAGALLRTTRYDGDSISVREALALGTPVVATDTGMRPDGCVLFPVGSVRGLVEAVGRALAAGRTEPEQGAAGDDLEQVLDVYRELAR